MTITLTWLNIGFLLIMGDTAKSGPPSSQGCLGLLLILLAFAWWLIGGLARLFP